MTAPRPRRRPAPRAVPIFVYGSNLDLAQLQRRCPSAAVVGVAHLRHFALTFAGHSDAWGGAVATIVRQRGVAVDGIVARVTLADLAMLDRYEGVPFAYTRSRLTVTVADAPIVAHVYRKPDDTPAGVPSLRYVTQLARGYRAFELDGRRLLAAVEGVVP
jgi:gamma-glutamylcyclotransferase (GGCT)/AIG2-like uncharacterized protein YtfP